MDKEIKADEELISGRVLVACGPKSATVLVLLNGVCLDPKTILAHSIKALGNKWWEIGVEEDGKDEEDG